MRKSEGSGQSARVVVFLLLGMLLASLPAAAQKREVIELTKEVELLRQEVKELRQTVERDNAVTKSLLEQALDAVNRMKTTVAEAEQSMRQSAQAAKAAEKKGSGLPLKYSQMHTTDLKKEVVEGENIIDIELTD